MADRVQDADRGHATGQLEDAGAGRRAVTELREPLEELGDDAELWSEQARSLAVFAAPGRVRTFRLPNRLASEVVVVATAST